MFLSTLFFALANVFVKQVGHLPTLEIVFFRCLLGVVLCYIGLRRAGADWRGSNRKLLFLRGFFGTTALTLFFLTLQNIPLASAMTIQYLSPIFTTIIAIFLLNESVLKRQWLFYGGAFAGVLLIERFDVRISLFYAAIAIFSAFCSGVAYNLVRSMRGREHPLTVVFHFQIFGFILGSVSLLFVREMPVGWDWLWLALIGLFSQLGQIFLTDALQKERAASVAIVNYTGLLYALIIGWSVFGEAQNLIALAGMLLVVISVIFSVFSAHRQNMNAALENSIG